jgi:membrane-associated protease RseP (regulator of RpoE activity)
VIRERIWLHALLLLLTLFTTTTLGSRLAYNFNNNLPAFDIEHDLEVYPEVLATPSLLLRGIPYGLTLLLILLAHEMGHYLACRYYGISASLPYFLPFPIGIGTFGAFIRFRSAVTSRRELFDVGVAGPLAGFLFLIPALGVGLALSKVAPGIARQGDMVLGTPLLMRLLESWLFPGVPSSDIYLHPVARAAWTGLLATGLNLLPVGQLDGGHLVYSAFGDRHRLVSLATIAALALLGFHYWPWFVWAAIFFLLGRRHFAVLADAPLGGVRRSLLALSALLFLLCFIPVPVQVQ